jgi:UDP-N-acetylmuramate--alanine ligase
MHIYFSGIGGTAIGPLALIARQAGYTVSGSDKQDSQYIQYLQKHGIDTIHIGQTAEQIAEIHAADPIDWFVYSSALPLENPDFPELLFVRENKIRESKRDELLNQILLDKKLKLIAVAGTHGKTTTTAMVVWLYKQLGLPLSYSVGAKFSFGDMGLFDPKSEYFAYECDEFDRNFLAYHPAVSIITGVTWDHHEIFPTRIEYKEAFKEFIGQSDRTIMWQREYEYLFMEASEKVISLQHDEPLIDQLQILGRYHRENARLVIQAVHEITGEPMSGLAKLMDGFPGTQRRYEKIGENLYSDYAHTPEKIRGVMSVAREFTERTGQKIVVVYEPLTNRRQHFMKDEYQDCFDGASKVYWIPSYLAREDPSQVILTPEELITHLSDPSLAEARERDDSLWETISEHREAGDLVLCIAGGGGDSLDEWLRAKLTAE